MQSLLSYQLIMTILLRYLWAIQRHLHVRQRAMRFDHLRQINIAVPDEPLRLIER